jgi:hypothetical protein
MLTETDVSERFRFWSRGAAIRTTADDCCRRLLGYLWAAYIDMFVQAVPNRKKN